MKDWIEYLTTEFYLLKIGWVVLKWKRFELKQMKYPVYVWRTVHIYLSAWRMSVHMLFFPNLLSLTFISTYLNKKPCRYSHVFVESLYWVYRVQRQYIARARTLQKFCSSKRLSSLPNLPFTLRHFCIHQTHLFFFFSHLSSEFIAGSFNLYLNEGVLAPKNFCCWNCIESLHKFYFVHSNCHWRKVLCITQSVIEWFGISNPDYTCIYLHIEICI